MIEGGWGRGDGKESWSNCCNDERWAIENLNGMDKTKAYEKRTRIDSEIWRHK